MGYEFARRRMVRRIAVFAAALLLITGALVAWTYRSAVAEPVVRRTEVLLPGISGTVRLVLISDIHIAGPDMPPQRAERIVRQINALRPDLVLIAGDFVSDKRTATRTYSAEDAVAPLGRLKPRLGSVAVLGNHDHWRDAGAIRRQLARAGIRVLDNDMARLGGLTIGGVDDPYTGQDQLALTVHRMRSKRGPRILLSHSPDVFPRVPRDVALTMAGHSHCGQISLPLVGTVATMSSYGKRYACGRVDEGGRTLIVSAGLGTSLLPLRLGVPPDIWMITLKAHAHANR
jgi:predicted MPP superfamily phosphohydrolase